MSQDSLVQRLRRFGVNPHSQEMVAMCDAAHEIERLQQILHDAGVAFTGSHQSCPTCRKIYNKLAAAEGWARFPDEHPSG